MADDPKDPVEAIGEVLESDPHVALFGAKKGLDVSLLALTPEQRDFDEETKVVGNLIQMIADDAGVHPKVVAQQALNFAIANSDSPRFLEEHDVK